MQTPTGTDTSYSTAATVPGTLLPAALRPAAPSTGMTGFRKRRQRISSGGWESSQRCASLPYCVKKKEIGQQGICPTCGLLVCAGMNHGETKCIVKILACCCKQDLGTGFIDMISMCLWAGLRLQYSRNTAVAAQRVRRRSFKQSASSSGHLGL